ncbi:hypothetical protein [Candidatus Fonsibacter ubiquis]|jgi:hypothetical protein|uniref:hypothetical protein n=1 Tax=Candidatus Fonsibacter ubiquis TaxID=1925548 RepID=UPI000C07800A|nr:hypothetical protein [Candidatus Fonsibacter ubiquis]
MSQKKELEKKISKIVKSELDKNNYEDTAWLKAFKEARGDKNEARAIYIEIRTRDLEDEFYEEQERIEAERIERENKIEQERIDKENRIYELRAKRDELRENRRVKNLEKSYSKKESNLRSSSQNENSFIETKIKPFIRGEESLAYSYWGIGVLLAIILALPLFIFENLKSDSAAIILGLYALAYIIFTIFVSIGIWRSAGFYVIEKNKKKENGFWGYAARVSVVLAIIRFFVEIVKELK